VEVRLAYERGLLSGKSLNYFQHWGLLYHMYLSRRREMEDRDSMLELQTLNLNPDMWVKLYRDRVMGALGVPTGEDEVELTEDDMDDLDAFMDQQERDFVAPLLGRQSMSGAEGPNDWRNRFFKAQADPLQWGPTV
jgi:hypothetical protein